MIPVPQFFKSHVFSFDGKSQAQPEQRRRSSGGTFVGRLTTKTRLWRRRECLSFSGFDARIITNTSKPPWCGYTIVPFLRKTRRSVSDLLRYGDVGHAPRGPGMMIRSDRWFGWFVPGDASAGWAGDTGGAAAAWWCGCRGGRCCCCQRF